MDKEYWLNYYNQQLTPREPSKFAQDIESDLEAGKFLLELGCGNGRDSIFFSKKGIYTTAIDQAVNMIDELIRIHKNENIEFIHDDFVYLKGLSNQKDVYDYIYSRFSLHSINYDQEKELIPNIYRLLKKNGKLFIETRSVHDDIYGKGKKVGVNEFIYNNHYRRFIVKEELEQRLINSGFIICKSIEGRDFAPYKNNNPIILRIIAEKN